MKTTGKKNGNVQSEQLPNWNLASAFYQSTEDPQIELDLKAFQDLASDLSEYRDLIAELSANEFYEFLKKYEKLMEMSRKLALFANLNSVTQQTDEKATAFKNRIFNELGKSEIQVQIGFIPHELTTLPEEKILEFSNSNRLREYIPWMKDHFFAYYLLDEVNSLILSQKSDVSQAWDRLYDETCARLKFKVGNKTYNEAQIQSLLGAAKTADERLKIQKVINQTYKDNEHILALAFNMLVKDKNINDSFSGADDVAYFSRADNRISKEDLLMMSSEVVDSYVPVSQRFYNLMAKIAKTDHWRYCDRAYNPVKITAKKPKSKYTWEQCIVDVIEAFAEFNADFAGLGAYIINNGWIDVAPKDGKSSGAFCVQGDKPFILLNFNEDKSYARTFAHELGHGIHHLLSSQGSIINDNTPTALAEVASEFAENMLFQKQLATAEDDKEKLSLLIDRVGDMVATIQRQIAFYKFEDRVHREAKKHELPAERISQIWQEEIKRYYGCDIKDEAEYCWMGVSHLFNQPFYVYSYAFAGLVVNNLIKAYEDGQIEEFPEKYMDMLANTGTENFRSLLEPFGIDASSSEFWANGMQLLVDYIDEIEKLAEKLQLI